MINPKRHDCTYPDKNLAGVGVALKLVQALCTRTGRAGWLPGVRQDRGDRDAGRRRAAQGENRIIAKLGLGMLSAGPAQGRPAIAARRLRADRQGDRQLSHRLRARSARQRRRPHEHAGHRRAAAAGLRRGDGRAKRAALAEQLNAENIRRQQEEAEIVAQAKKVVETDLEIGARTVIVVAGEGWHRGVIGIVASKLVDAFHRPAIVLSIDGDVAHGSCRSIPSFNMLGGARVVRRADVEVRRPQAGGRA